MGSFARLGIFRQDHSHDLGMYLHITDILWSMYLQSLAQLGVFPRDHSHDLGVFVQSHSPRCAPLDTLHYDYVSNEKLTDHLAGLVVGPLLGIFIYSLFSMFNISG